MTHITVRIAGQDDIPAIAEIMKKAADQLPDRSVYVTDDENFIRRNISEDGFTFLAECDGIRVGFLIVHVPGDSEENLGRAAGLPDKELPYTAHMESAAVLPKYWGHGIQRMLMMEAEKELRRRGFRYAAATVSPANLYSMENCMKMGYIKVDEREMYGKTTRDIVFRRL